jgi:choline kinase
MQKPIQALIAAGGYGTRMMLSEASSKCLLEIGGKTLLARLLLSLHKSGIKKVIIATHSHSYDEVEKIVEQGPNFEEYKITNSEHGFRKIPSSVNKFLDEQFLFVCGHHILPEQYIVEMLEEAKSHKIVVTLYDNQKFPNDKKDRLIYNEGTMEYISDSTPSEYLYTRNPFIVDNETIKLSARDNFSKPFSYYIFERVNHLNDFGIVKADFPPEFDTRTEFEETKKYFCSVY